MKIHENKLRELIYSKYQKNFFDRINKPRKQTKISFEDLYDFPQILKKQTEEKINSLILNLEDMEFIGQEIQLKKEDASTTRIDLIAMTLDHGLAIIELKKSTQTEREAFTELLAYSNYFCSLFHGASETTSVISILIAPMQTRIVQDAFFQELMLNNKNIIALIPKADTTETNFQFDIYYPSNNFYNTFTNSIFNDSSIHVAALTFELVDGWIDSWENDNNTNNDYVKDAFNIISSNIAFELEAKGYHSLVYGSQRWKEHHELFPYPNVIYVVTLNPYAYDLHGAQIWSPERETRLDSFINQLNYDTTDFYCSPRTQFIESCNSGFENNLWNVIAKSFRSSFLSSTKSVDHEFSSIGWSHYKNSMIESVFFHHFDIFQTGIFRKIILEYIQQTYSLNPLDDFYRDDMPMFAYDAYRNFFFSWQTIKSLGTENLDEKF